MVTAWVKERRPVGRLQTTLKHMHVKMLQEILGQELGEDAKLNSWIPLAADKAGWKHIGEMWIQKRKRETEHYYGDHPLLGAGLRD